MNKILRILNVETSVIEEITERDVLEMANKIISFLELCEDEEFVQDIVDAIWNNEPFDLDEELEDE